MAHNPRLVPVEIRGETRYLTQKIIDRINDDGTLTCYRCDKRIPPQENPQKRVVNILWNHQGIRCQVTEGDLSR